MESGNNGLRVQVASGNEMDCTRASVHAISSVSLARREEWTNRAVCAILVTSSPRATRRTLDVTHTLSLNPCNPSFRLTM